MRTVAPSLIVAACLALPARAQPETVPLGTVPSNGVLGNPANAIRTFSLSGGYSLGRVDLTGTLTSNHPDTVLLDARVVVTPPVGPPLTIQVFTQGATFTSTLVNILAVCACVNLILTPTPGNNGISGVSSGAI